MKKVLNIIKRQNGFTVVELLFALAIAGVLAAIAVPVIDSVTKGSAVRSHQYAYNSALAYARGEAVSRSSVVSMCHSNDTATCSGSWGDGWIIFVDDGAGGGTFGDGVHNGGEEIIRVYDYTGNNNSRIITINDDGTTGSLLDSLTWDHNGNVYDVFTSRTDVRAMAQLCEQSSDTAYARAVYIERSGRTMLSQDFNDDGIHNVAFESATGTFTDTINLTCP